MSRWMPRVNGYSPGSPSRPGRSSGRSLSAYRDWISIPESVNRRGSSAPTIGAIVRCSSVVAMASRLPGNGNWASRSEHLRQEGLGALVARRAEHLRRWPRFDHDAFVHEHDLVGDLAREPHLVRDHDHRFTDSGI